MNLRVRRRGVIADLRDIHGIEHVVRTAVITVHIDLTVFRHDAVDLFIRQRFQGASTTLARAGALKFHILRIVNRHFFFVVQTPQHVGRRQGEQLFRFDGFRQRCQMLEITLPKAVTILTAESLFQQRIALTFDFDKYPSWPTLYART